MPSLPARRRFRARHAALLLAIVSPVVVGHHARAAWPPPADATPADLANPENWPNDPGYGWDTNGDGVEDQDGQWNYYSFMVPNDVVRPSETATGMSIDMAWRITRGDPRVVIAVTDSGIKWDEADVIEAAYINHRELQNHRPTLANGDACGDLDPQFYPGADAAELAGFDCNGDGIVSVGDWALTPTLTPAATETNPQGDRNRNGHLDAGDLILAFSDGTDDDQNGYVDDISGWDFMKDDNDPYDDTRYGHGTGEARDSTSRANNGMGTAGGCNECRLLNLRVGDSFITDVNDFGQAVIYATDMRAKLVQSALGTVNMSNFAQAALDYAWDNGTLTVASMADENARHHNMPTAANHTLPVHAIQYAGGGDITKARTFLEYHPCSNFGGQNFLSGAGNGCSSEAVGQTSGITGLVYSAGLQFGHDLRPGEVMQLLMMSADDIDVPESRAENAEDRWSQPGFDQRFGYGRVNANRAVEMVRDGKIPPVVDVVSPRWFTVLYKDQVTAPVEIEGSISAPRAPSYDWTLEWAPGVQPLDGEFQALDGATNVPGDTVTGGSGPIGSIDVRNIDPTHVADVDSPYGENQYTITVRIRAVAHYGGEVGDVAGELRRTYYVHSDPTLVKGFPIFVGDSGESSPKMADIDGDGVRDIVYATAGGVLHVLRITPEGPVPVSGFPFRTRRMDGLNEVPEEAAEPSYLSAPGYDGPIDPDLGRESLTTSAPAIADVDGDGENEIVLTTYVGTVYVLERDGSVKDGWPKRVPRVPSCSLDPDVPDDGPCMSTESLIARGAFAAPVLEDMDVDGDLDVIVAAFDGNVYVWDAVTGDDVAGFPIAVRYDGALGGIVPPPNRIFTTPAVADFNEDGIPDLLVATNQKLTDGGNSGAAYLIDGRGTDAPSPVFPNWPVTMTSLNLFPLVAEGITNAGVVGDFDGQMAAVQHGNASLPLILPLDPGPQSFLGANPPNILPVRDDGTLGIDPSNVFGELSPAQQPNTMLPLFSQPALGDVDQDGVPDVLSSGGSLTLAINIQSPSASLRGDNLLAMWSGKTGKMLPAAPVILEDFTFLNSSAVADLTGDGYPEVLIGSGGYYLHAYDGCGREPEGWPKFTGQWIIPTPAVGDLDGDGTLEVVTGTRNGWLYAWHTEGTTDNVIEWESYHHDNRNTGNHALELEQGGPSTASEPLSVAVCEAGTPGNGDVSISVSGGCACSTEGRRGGETGGLVALGLVAALAARRRRAA